jgi:hypothetical protein
VAHARALSRSGKCSAMGQAVGGLDSLRRLTGGQGRLEIIAGSTVGRRLVDLWFVCKLLGSEGLRRQGINTGIIRGDRSTRDHR